METSLKREFLDAVHDGLKWPGLATIVRQTDAGAVTETVTVITSRNEEDSFGGTGVAGAPVRTIQVRIRLYRDTTEGINQYGCAAAPTRGDTIALPVPGGASNKPALKIASVSLSPDGQAAVLTIEDAVNNSW